MDIDFRRINTDHSAHDIDKARHLSKKLAARNKQLKFLAGYVRQFDQIFANQDQIVEQLSNQLQKIKQNRSKSKSPENRSSLFKHHDSKIEKLKEKITNKPSRIPNKLESKKFHVKSKTQEDELGIKLPKLTPQKRSVLNFEEDHIPSYKQQSPLSEKKIIKLPIDRLIPISYEDIRKRIQSKLL